MPGVAEIRLDGDGRRLIILVGRGIREDKPDRRFDSPTNPDRDDLGAEEDLRCGGGTRRDSGGGGGGAEVFVVRLALWDDPCGVSVVFTTP